MEEMFVDGFDEKHIGIALDVFLRDYGQFKETDLEKEIFRNFVRELGINMVTFTKEQNFVKAAKFIDYYCIADPTIWVNLEQYVIKKENMFSASSLISILESVAA